MVGTFLQLWWGGYLQGGDEISPTRLCNFGGGEEISPTLLWNFEGGGEISPTLLSKLEGGEEISPQGEFPPRVPSWPRKSGDCHPGHRYFAKSYFRRLLVMITYSCFLQWYPQQDIHGWCHQYVFCCTSLYSRTLCRWEKKKTFLFTDMILQQRRKFLLKTLDLSLDFPHLGPIPPNQIYLIFWPECPFKLTFGGGGSSSLSSTSSSS